MKEVVEKEEINEKSIEYLKKLRKLKKESKNIN